ncbi:hypothetical protein AB0B52_28575 [Streptomyces griseofuscus]|uniref:hypothetical protein n=1 Tax=Streptomyces griseofuscus TaxID=146922 RepID=UPI0033DD7226
MLVIACAFVLAGYRCDLRFEIRRPPVPGLPALPPQRASAPHREYVELSAGVARRG